MNAEQRSVWHAAALVILLAALLYERHSGALKGWLGSLTGPSLPAGMDVPQAPIAAGVYSMPVRNSSLRGY